MKERTLAKEYEANPSTIEEGGIELLIDKPDHCEQDEGAGPPPLMQDSPRISAKKEIVEWLRQRSRPYLFSNTLAPVITATSIKVLDIIATRPELRQQLFENVEFFRGELSSMGFTLAGAGHPIIPVMLGDAELAQKFAELMLNENVYVIGFSFPVVPEGQARIRTQMSAAHSREDLENAIEAFEKVGNKLGIIK